MRTKKSLTIIQDELGDLYDILKDNKVDIKVAVVLNNIAGKWLNGESLNIKIDELARKFRQMPPPAGAKTRKGFRKAKAAKA